MHCDFFLSGGLFLIFLILNEVSVWQNLCMQYFSYGTDFCNIAEKFD